MELFVMRYVLAVAEHKNFSLAAHACHIGQPALSQQISKLEKELGVTLFLRNSRGATLTEAGEEFVRRAREILQHAEALGSEMSLYAGLYRGTMNVGVITSLQCIDFGGMLSAYCSTYPHISVNIQQGGTHILLQQMIERKLDLAFLNKPLGGVPNGVEFLGLGQDRFHVAVPADHPLAQQKTIKLSMLKNERFIFHQAGQVASELCFKACQKAGFEPNIVCRSSSPTTGFYMVRGGLGVALFPSEEFRGRNLEGVAELVLEEDIIKEVGVAWRQDASSPLVHAAVDFAKEWVKKASLV